MQKFKASVTTYDNGKIVIDPYKSTERSRYENVLDLEFGSLSATKSDFRLVLRVPRKNGLIRSLALMTEDLNRTFESVVTPNNQPS